MLDIFYFLPVNIVNDSNKVNLAKNLVHSTIKMNVIARKKVNGQAI